MVAGPQGRIAARNIPGSDERCDIVRFFWTQQYDVSLSYVGHAVQWDRAEPGGSPSERGCRVSYGSGGRKSVAATIFRGGESLAEKLAFEEALAAKA